MRRMESGAQRAINLAVFVSTYKPEMVEVQAKAPVKMNRMISAVLLASIMPLAGQAYAAKPLGVSYSADGKTESGEEY